MKWFQNSHAMYRAGIVCSVICCSMGLKGCAAPTRHEPPPAEAPAPAPAPTTTVKASYYGVGDGLAGKRTASGEPLNPTALTAAHPTLPLGTVLEVKNPKSGKRVRVRVNDRGPFVRGRGLDLTPAAANKIGLKKEGVANVEVNVVEKPVKTPETPPAGAVTPPN